MAGRSWWHWSVWKCISPSGSAPIGLPLADVGDQHHGGMVAHELLGVDHRRWTEFFREADLIVLAQLLVAQQDDEVRVPGVADLREGAIVDLLPEIDPDDLGAQGRRQRPHGEHRTRHLRLDLSAPRFHPRHSIAVDAAGVSGAAAHGGIMGRAGAPAQGSLASTRMKAMRHGSLPRLTQAWLVPCCTRTSPAFKWISESSSSMSISPDMTMA